ncbi:LysR family transcriptional regulator, partial [Streptomyces sp. TRM76130]|nr:LysR family transcriptional regulator [Streptomyces sp. TRM76130]
LGRVDFVLVTGERRTTAQDAADALAAAVLASGDRLHTVSTGAAGR